MTLSIGWLPTMSSLDFENYWQILHSSMNTLLTLSPGEYPPISYEVTHSAVYKCVCNGYAEDLFRKLINAITTHLESEVNRLKTVPDEDYLEKFNNVYARYVNGLGCIVPIFNYLARFYVEAKLNLNLKQELIKLFDRIIIESNLERLLTNLANPPGYIAPSVCENLVKCIHELRPECVSHYPVLFQKFIPGLFNITQDQLPDLQLEAREMINQAEFALNNDVGQNNQRGIKRERMELDDNVELKHFRQD